MRLLLSGLVLLALTTVTSCCYDHCIRTYIAEVDHGNKFAPDITAKKVVFCRAMSNQIQCLYNVQAQCPPQSKALIQSILNIFIQPDYQRTCGSQNMTTPMPVAPTLAPPTGLPTNGMTTRIPVNLNPNQLLITCSRKVSACQATFNSTATPATTRMSFNITEICQKLKKFTLCFVNLLSTDCGTFVPRNSIYNIQRQYGSMCSPDAQENTNTLLDCTTQAMGCHTQFNDSFTPAVADYNLRSMCGSINNYTECVQAVGQDPECSPYTRQILSGIGQLKLRHNAFCGSDNGETAHQCVQDFEDCYSPFNTTFFPALHASNLTMLCNALKQYTSCVVRLRPMCSQQLGQVIKSAQVLKSQYAEKCHPEYLELAKCTQLTACTTALHIKLRTALAANSGICGAFGDYFPCVEKSLDECGLDKLTTEVDFGDLGSLMTKYCDRISGNSEMLQCPAFVKCTTAVMMTFNPDMRNTYEGSTWCTFLQLSIGCAEHALQSTGCTVESNTQLQKHILELDDERTDICELADDGFHGKGDDDNLVDPDSSKNKGGENGAKSLPVMSGLTLTALTLALSWF